MKHSAAVTGTVVLLLMSASAHADDFTWDGGAGTTAWAKIANWNVASKFPGSGSPASVVDRVVIDVSTDMPVTFSSHSGASQIPGVDENRAIQALYLDGNGSSPAQVALLVTGDTLYVRRVFMISGNGANKEAALKVTADNAFRPEIMNLAGTFNSRVELIFEADVRVETETRVTGNVNIQVTDGFVFDAGPLIISNGVITGDSTFVFPGE